MSVTTEMLSHLVVELPTPARDNPSRAMPTIKINPRKSFANDAYSDSFLPKIVIPVSFEPVFLIARILAPSGRRSKPITDGVRHSILRFRGSFIGASKVWLQLGRQLALSLCGDPQLLDSESQIRGP